MRILSDTYPWSRKYPLNFGSNADPEQFLLSGGTLSLTAAVITVVVVIVVVIIIIIITITQRRRWRQLLSNQISPLSNTQCVWLDTCSVVDVNSYIIRQVAPLLLSIRDVVIDAIDVNWEVDAGPQRRHY